MTSPQTTTLKLIKPHTGGQRALYMHPARFHVVACGRRWGKTELGKLLVYEALFRYQVPVWWIAPTYKMSSAIWRELRTQLAPFTSDVNGQDRMLWLPDGHGLTVWTADSADTMRGGGPGLVIIDEAAMIRDATMWPAVVRPALTDRRGRAVFLSTPRGRNWFYDLYLLGIDPLHPDYKSWRFPSWYNPMLPAGEFEEARSTLPQRFYDQEYGAIFIEDAGGVFRGVLQVATADYRKPYPGRFVAAVDWGRSNDYTVISVFDADTGVQVDLDRYNKIGWELQRGRIIAMYEKWRPDLILAEENSMGSPNIEALQTEGLPVRAFQTTAQSKPPLIESLALAIERQRITLLNDRIQTAELQAYEMERMPGGSFRYTAPAGAHDDTVMATALAWHAVKNMLRGEFVAVVPSVADRRRQKRKPRLSEDDMLLTTEQLATRQQEALTQDMDGS